MTLLDTYVVLVGLTTPQNILAWLSKSPAVMYEKYGIRATVSKTWHHKQRVLQQAFKEDYGFRICLRNLKEEASTGSAGHPKAPMLCKNVCAHLGRTPSWHARAKQSLAKLTMQQSKQNLGW